MQGQNYRRVEAKPGQNSGLVRLGYHRDGDAGSRADQDIRASDNSKPWAVQVTHVPVDLLRAAAARLRKLDRIEAALGDVWTADEIRWAVGDGRVVKMAYYPLDDMLRRLAAALEGDDGGTQEDTTRD